MRLTDLPTEAEVAEWRTKPFLTIGQDRRLLALVEAWAPSVKRLADDADRQAYTCPSAIEARDLWRRWKGEEACGRGE